MGQYFFRDKPLFGLDIGRGSLKIMQLYPSTTIQKIQPRIQGYGTISFDPSAIDDGVIVKPEIIASALKELFKKQIIGSISTRRVALSIPTYRTFTRAINLPIIKPKDLINAIKTEATNYIPMPLDELNLDWEVVNKDTDNQDLMVVAVPKKIIDSYSALCRIINLEPVVVQTTMHAAANLLSRGKYSDIPTMIIDFGSLSSDLCLSDQGKILVMGTVQGGGDNFSHVIEKKLKISFEAAGLIKNKYGLGVSKKQSEIIDAMRPTLTPIEKEVKRMLRYYEDRFSGHKQIGQIVILGGGANMPGLGDYLTASLRLPARSFDPWQYLDANRLQPPAGPDKTMFSTASGLSFINPSEIFA